MRRIKVILEIVAIFILPIVVFYLDFVPYIARFAALEMFTALGIFLAIKRKMDFRAMGFRMDTFVPAMKLLVPAAVITLAVVYILYRLDFATEYFFDGWWKNEFFLYYLIVGVPSQEFGYRGFLLRRLQDLSTNTTFLVVTSAVLFSLLHVLHEDVYLLLGTFIFSLYLTWAYVKRPNILASSLIHGIVGTAAIVWGFF